MEKKKIVIFEDVLPLIDWRGEISSYEFAKGHESFLFFIKDGPYRDRDNEEIKEDLKPLFGNRCIIFDPSVECKDDESMAKNFTYVLKDRPKETYQYLKPFLDKLPEDIDFYFFDGLDGGFKPLLKLMELPRDKVYITSSHRDYRRDAEMMRLNLSDKKAKSLEEAVKSANVDLW